MKCSVLFKSTIFFLIGLNQFYSFGQGITAHQVDSIVEKTIKTFDVPGIAVGIIKDGKLILAKGYGVRSLNTMQKVDEHTLFGIASNSKAFTSAALGMLVDEGKLKWDDKVTDYIPEFKLYNPYVTDEFTVRDLLTHRSGLGLGAGDLMFWPDSNNFTKQDMIHNLRYLKQVSGFRSKYDYDNNMYMVAGEVLQRITGMSWEDFIQTRILDPLGMSETAPTFKRLKNKSNVIDPHAPVNGKVVAIRRDWSENVAAAGGINSNIVDLSKWLIMQLNNGKYGPDNKQLFSTTVHDEFWTPQTIIPVRNPGPYRTHFSSYGLGWFLSDVMGYKQVTHTGGLAGNVTQITLIPELNLGIIVLTNQQVGAAFNAITNSIKDAYFGIKADRIKEYHDQFENFENQAKNTTTAIWKDIDAKLKLSANDQNNLAMFVGTYRDPWFGDVVISNTNGHLYFESKRSFTLKGELLPYKGSTFVLKLNERSYDADAFIRFGLDEDGNATGFKMNPISPTTDFSFDFQDLDFHKTTK